MNAKNRKIQLLLQTNCQNGENSFQIKYLKKGSCVSEFLARLPGNIRAPPVTLSPLFSAS